MARNEDNRKFGIDIKIIIVGNSSTGKTSVVNRYILNKFETGYKATITSQFFYKIIKIDGIIYRLQFWDMAGQDRTMSLGSIFCKDSQGVVFCCEVDNPKSREDIIVWKQELIDKTDINDIPIIVIENKCDKLGDDSNYDDGIEELKKFSDENGFEGYFRTSALNGHNIEKAMTFLLNIIVKNLNENDYNTYNDSFDTKRLSINSLRKREKNNKCC